jgi:hypothetical protein
MSTQGLVVFRAEAIQHNQATPVATEKTSKLNRDLLLRPLQFIGRCVVFCLVPARLK